MIITGSIVLFAGFLFRLWASSSKFIQSIVNKNEIVSPLTSWKRVTEGLLLKRNGISPYDGDVFHQTPLMLNLLDTLEGRWSVVMPGVFVICDMVAAVLIGCAVHQTILFIEKCKPHYHKDLDERLLLTSKSFRGAVVYSMAVYVFNPYSVTACMTLSTAVFDNILLALVAIFTFKGWRLLATAILALSAYQNFYTLMLVIPVALALVQRDVLGMVKFNNLRVFRSLIFTVTLTLFFLISLLYYSKSLIGSWEFLRGTYGFILTAPELTPNMGIFWYFFTEMFQHFEHFFLIVFQVNVFIYTLPLSIRLRHHPEFLFYMLVVIISIFKSYPSYADVGFYISFIPCWAFTNKYLRSPFIVTNMFIWCAVLSPIFYHLWIYSGSANANFYFALTLVSTAAQIFYASDMLFAYMRRDYDLFNPKLKPAPDTASESEKLAPADNVFLK